jgi:hypothetical protein
MIRTGLRWIDDKGSEVTSPTDVSDETEVVLNLSTTYADVRWFETWAEAEGVTIAEIIRRALVTQRYLQDQQSRGALVIVREPNRRSERTIQALGRTVPHSEPMTASNSEARPKNGAATGPEVNGAVTEGGSTSRP